jgi:hypothetical protein
MGSDLGLNYCNPTPANCTATYVASPDTYQSYSNKTGIQLKGGEMCNITIDATQGLGRVIFESYFPSDALGVWEYPQYMQGDIITFLSGVNTLTVYNANQGAGSVTFTVSFSGASMMALSLGFSAALLALF